MIPLRKWVFKMSGTLIALCGGAPSCERGVIIGTAKRSLQKRFGVYVLVLNTGPILPAAHTSRRTVHIARWTGASSWSLILCSPYSPVAGLAQFNNGLYDGKSSSWDSILCRGRRVLSSPWRPERICGPPDSYPMRKVGRTPACVKTYNSQDTMYTSTVETNEIMKTAAHRSESWCWRQLHAADTCSKTRHVPFLCVKTQTSVLKEQHQCTLSA
jgi:hypothetical protein